MIIKVAFSLAADPFSTTDKGKHIVTEYQLTECKCNVRSGPGSDKLQLPQPHFRHCFPECRSTGTTSEYQQNGGTSGQFIF